MQHYSQAIVTILSLVNPVICGAIFSGLVTGKPFASVVSDASRAILAVAIILCLAAVFGARLLHVFGISLDVFRAAGGLVLMWMGFRMLSGASSLPSSAGTASSDSGPNQNPSLSSLILFAASPGTITGVITISVHQSRDALPIPTLVAIGVAVMVTWVVIILSARAGGGKPQGSLHDLTSRFMGLIVLAMGMQFLLSGLKAFFGFGVS